MPEISRRSYSDRPACSGGSGGTCVTATIGIVEYLEPGGLVLVLAIVVHPFS